MNQRFFALFRQPTARELTYARTSMDPIQRPDPRDPATPPYLAWRSSPSHDVVLVWRKATNVFVHYSGCNSMCVLSAAGSTSYYFGGENDREMRPIPVPRLHAALLNALFPNARGALRTRLDRLLTARAINERIVSGPWHFRSVELMHTEHDWRGARQTMRGMAPLMKALVVAFRDGYYRDAQEALSDLRDHGNDLDAPYRRMLVDAADRIADRESEGHGLELADCGHVEHHDDTRCDSRGRTYCQECADDQLVTIDDGYYRREDVYYWESDDEYHLYEEESEDDDDDDDEPSSPHLESWGTAANSGRLDHDESFTPSALGDFTLGVELEVECNSHHIFADAVDQVAGHMNADMRYAMFKRDGSLSDNGFEIVTAARRLDEHIAMFSAWTPHRSLSAWNPGTCGVHVHIDSRAFSGLTLGKFLMFVNDIKNKAFIKALAGRHPDDGGNAQSYCAAVGQEHLDTPAKALKGGHFTRYRMVNLCNLRPGEAERLGAETERECKGNYSTVELRIFRASLKKERLLAQIEFSHALVMFCRVASWHALNGDAFKAWLAPMAGRYKHLARWFGINLPKPNRINPAPVLAAIDESC